MENSTRPARAQSGLTSPNGNGRHHAPQVTPTIAWAFSRAVTGLPLNGEVADLGEPYKSMVDHLVKLPLEDRSACFQTMLFARSERDNLVKAMADIDPSGPAPDDKVIRFATMADVRRVMQATRWLWHGWIPASSIVGIASPEGTGKTRFGLDLQRRVWNGLPWPDSQAMTIPKGTPSLWVCADGQHPEMLEDLPLFGLPDEAMILPALSDQPYDNTSLDDPETFRAIQAAIIAHKPWCICVDTLTYATELDVCEQRTIARLKKPLVELAQRYQIVIMLFLHVSAEGHALGRRIKGITRSLLHLECPDPTDSGRLRLWVEKGHNKKPMALGVTMSSDGNTYDLKPPDKLCRTGRGRPSEARDKAKEFILEKLSKEDNQIVNDLASQWEKTGGSKYTLWRAAEDLQESGDVVSDGGPGTKTQTALHLVQKQNS